MAVDVRYVEWLFRLLAFIGGVASTVVGSWISSKFRVYHDNRKAHLDDLKQRVLVPLRDGLEQHFRPLVFHQTLVVFVLAGATTQFHEKAKATEDPTEQGDVLVAAFPSAKVFSLLDSALLQDASKSHFRKHMSQVDTFMRRWTAHAGECHRWALKTAEQILTRSGLLAFPPPCTTGPGSRPYVMHYRLAVFVYKRLFRIPTQALRTDQPDSYWTLNGEDSTLALGSKEQIDALVKALDNLLESEEATARTLRAQAGELQRSFQELTPELDHAVASRRLRGKCDLVTFF